MEIYPIKYKDMQVQYLMALVQKKCINVEEIGKVLLKKFESLKLKELLDKWAKESNITLKELFEVAIARKIVDYSLVCCNTEFSNLINKFLLRVTSLDAICILTCSYNEQINKYAYQKYHELLDAYLDTFEDNDLTKQLYLTEGNDLDFLQSKVIEYKKRGE